MPSPTPAPPLVDAAPSVPSLRTLGTGATQAAAGNDSRFGAGGAITQLHGDGEAGPGVGNQLFTLINIPSATTLAGFLHTTAIAAPSTPAAGSGRIYFDSTSKNLAVKDDAGVVKHGVKTKASVSNQFLIAIADDGTVTSAQPAASDVTGLAAIATSGSASDLGTGTLPAARLPAFTGDITTSAGSSATTLAASGVTAAMYGDASHVSQVTFDAKGRATSAVAVAIAIAAGAVSGLAAVATSGSASDLGSGTLPATRLPAFTGDITTSAGTSATTLANIPTGVPVAGSMLATAIAAPSTPAAGKGAIYVDSTSKNLAVKDDAGTVKHGVQTKAAVTSTFLTAISDAGVVLAAQPASTDLSDGTSAGRALFTAANAGAQRTALSLVPGTDVEAWSAVLDILAGLTPAADRLPYFTGSGTAALTTLSAFGRTLIDDADASASRTTLGLGTIATQDASAVTITGGSITGMSSPSASSDVATKGYVDGLVSASIAWKNPVLVATTTTGTLATAYANGQTVDGVVLSTGDRILLKDQTSGTENGVYSVNASGAPTRATDADTGAELVSAAVFASKGTANADRAFVCTNDSITLGVTSIVFVAFASAVGALIAASNLSDLTSVSTARTNLGLVAVASSGSASDLTTGTLAAARLPAFTGDITTSAGSSATTLANIPTAVPMAGTLLATAIAAPSTPAAGKGAIYVDSTSKNLSVKDDAGVVKHGVQTKASVSHQFLTAIADDGTVTAAQPAATDISGLATVATSGSASDLSAGTLPAARLPAFTGDITTSAGSSATTLANIPTGVPVAGSLLATAIAAPSTPAAGKGAIYVDSTSKNLAVKDDAGVIKHGVRTKASTSHQFLISIDDDGTVTAAQPSTSDISGLGSIATQASSSVSITGGTITGITDLAIADGGTGASTAIAAIDGLSTKSSNIASASTTDLSTATGTFVHITGTTTITAFGTCAAGVERILVFDGALTLTHNATSLILLGGASINTAAGDAAIFRSEGSGNWRCVNYIRAAFSPYGGSTVFAGTTLTLGLSALAGDDVVVSGFADAVLINCPTTAYSICNGLSGGVDGKVIFLHNTAAYGTGPLQLTPEATSSAAANRFSTNNGSIYLYGTDSCMLRYSGANQRWEALNYPGAKATADNTGSHYGSLSGAGAIQFSDYSSPGAFATTASLFGTSPCNVLIDGGYDSIVMCGIKTNRRIQEALGTDTASANDLTLPGWVFGSPAPPTNAGAGNTYHITGTTTINRILAGGTAAGGWQAGSRISLIFDGTLILTDGTASGSNYYGFKLKGRSSRETHADMVLELVFDGSWWIER